ncbi:MAG TPA: tetratricopeptide repeat protein [Phycisphaerae bacterium]|jgi:predicted O-linked N-acetylglucosamine transferase (SPINDLY family)
MGIKMENKLQFPIEQALARGREYHGQGQLQLAESIYRQVLAEQPNHVLAIHLLGILCGQTRRMEVCIDLIKRAIAIGPAESSMYNNLGKFLGDMQRYDEAIAAIQEAIRLAPSNSSAYYNLGTAHQNRWDLDSALAAYQTAQRLNPAALDVANNLGITLASKGRHDESAAVHRHALALNPHQPVTHSNLVYGLHFHPAYGTQDLKRELAEWSRIHAEPLAAHIRAHSNDRSPERRLRIGYVSPDFRDHVVGRNLLPLLRHHDATQFEIHCFSTTPANDFLTETFRRLAYKFHDIGHLADLQAVDLIRNLSIDILVDLSLHLAGNRLGVFACKPAPVQVTFAGYPGSTGLRTIDYRLTDRYLDPPGNDDDYVERSFRLPDTFWCFDPVTTAPDIHALPALQKGYVTFGCLNTFRKINDITLELWSGVLAAIHDSRLFLLAPEGDHRLHILDLLGKRGISAERIAFATIRPRIDYLNLYQAIDIGLDTLPYNGHSTSLDSFYMGVPVVTRVGTTVVGRAGLSQLMNLGLPELIAETDEAFLSIATGLARDLPRLAALRLGLRSRMEASPLMDAPRFTHTIESVYRQMWRQRCERT